ncbi:MAG: hypothetical protein ABIA04_04440 [Pseudomonadota bacterium]
MNISSLFRKLIVFILVFVMLGVIAFISSCSNRANRAAYRQGGIYGPQQNYAKYKDQRPGYQYRNRDRFKGRQLPGYPGYSSMSMALELAKLEAAHSKSMGKTALIAAAIGGGAGIGLGILGAATTGGSATAAPRPGTGGGVEYTPSTVCISGEYHTNGSCKIYAVAMPCYNFESPDCRRPAAVTPPPRDPVASSTSRGPGADRIPQEQGESQPDYCNRLYEVWKTRFQCAATFCEMAQIELCRDMGYFDYDDNKQRRIEEREQAQTTQVMLKRQDYEDKKKAYERLRDEYFLVYKVQIAKPVQKTKPAGYVDRNPDTIKDLKKRVRESYHAMNNAYGKWYRDSTKTSLFERTEHSQLRPKATNITYQEEQESWFKQYVKFAD